MHVEGEALTGKIIGCAMVVHKTLGPGYLEAVYEKALAHEMYKAGLAVECQKPIRVTYDGVVVGEFVADMLVESRVVVEIKAVQALTQAHEVQLVNYLTATGIEIGLLLNFGASRLQPKRKYRTYRPKNGSVRQDQQDGQESKNGLISRNLVNPVTPVNPVKEILLILSSDRIDRMNRMDGIDRIYRMNRILRITSLAGIR